jgi:hypothetical protein
MKTLKLLPIMFLMLSYNLFPDCSVSGYVKEINTDIPIHRATINVFEDNKHKKDQERDLYIVKTDKKGFFNIAIVTPGNYSIYVEIPGVGMIGYINIGGPDFYKFKIKKGQNIKFNFIIGRSYIPIQEKKISEDGNIITVKIVHIIHNKRDKSNRCHMDN